MKLELKDVFIEMFDRVEKALAVISESLDELEEDTQRLDELRYEIREMLDTL